jgi:gluconolactonase
VAYEFERLGTGFLFTEGPVWHPTDDFLLFSDMPGDHLRRWSERDGVTTFRKPCNMSNGLTYDRQGRLLVCEHRTSQVTRTEPGGEILPIATHYGGKQLNSPNDIVCRSDGSIYFSDPPYGRVEFYGVVREQELDFQGVFRVGPTPTEPVLLIDDFERPNGLCFSLDESRLFINDTARKHIRVFGVGGDGSLRNGRVWAETKGDKPGAPDGMKIDSAGNVYCCGPGGIHVFDTAGSLREIIEVPERTANFAFGGDDLRSLFITASTSLYRTRVATPGWRVF